MTKEALALRRSSILAMMIPVFASKGYEGTTTVDLEKATGLSRGALFHHFNDKLTMFELAARMDSADGIRAYHELGFPENVKWRLRTENQNALGMYVHVLSMIKNNSEFRSRWMNNQDNHSSIASTAISELQADGTLRADVSAETLAAVMAIVTDGLLLHAAAFGPDSEPVDDILRIIQDGLKPHEEPNLKPRKPKKQSASQS